MAPRPGNTAQAKTGALPMTLLELQVDALFHVLACKVRDAQAMGATPEQIEAAALANLDKITAQARGLVDAALSDPFISSRVTVAA
jgi:hypothetical protein